MVRSSCASAIWLAIVRFHTGSTRAHKPTELDRVRVVDLAARRRSYSTTTSRSLTRTDTPLRDTPQSATVLTRAVIADQAMQGMADVVRYVPGMTMGLGEGHRDQPTIRGNSSTADFFVNGVRDDAQYLRDLYNVERVEAIRGANAMVFGRGGGGGVINRVSKQAGFAPLAQLTLEGGSFDHARETGDVNLPIGSRLAVRVNGMLERSGSFRDFYHLRREAVNPPATIFARSAASFVSTRLNPRFSMALTSFSQLLAVRYHGRLARLAGEGAFRDQGAVARLSLE